MVVETKQLEALKKQWAVKWPEALALWSKFTKLSEPRWCLTDEEAVAESLSGSFAMIRLADQGVVISLKQIAENKLEAFPLEIMAHEIGHHVFCPGDLTDSGRMLARIRRGLPTKEHLAGFVSNLYSDLLINDRLQRSANLKMAEVYRTLGKNSQDLMWTFYMRIYEILWSLKKGSLAGGTIQAALEGDAQLGAKLIRSYAKDWLKGAGRFAALCFTYLVLDEGKTLQELLRGFWDIKNIGENGFPDGLTEVDADEGEVMHPAFDEDLSDIGGEGPTPLKPDLGHHKPAKTRRDIIEYGEILKSLGVNLAGNEVAKKYYRELAMPYLVRFPQQLMPEAMDPLLEGLEHWDAGESIDQLDWFESQLRSPYLIPGYTTVQRSYGSSQGSSAGRKALNLYLGIDCSGSMPDPQRQLSYPVLAGTILALSALRAGAKVKVVLSGEPGRYHSTEGFISDENEIFKVLTEYLGTGYSFGIHRLGETFLTDDKALKPTHILIISDIDIFWTLERTESGENGWSIAKESLLKAQGGASYVLHMPEDYHPEGVARMREAQWNVYPVVNLEDLIKFAREFGRAHYER